MNTFIIACNTIKPELLHAREAVGCDYPIIWSGAGLHDTPKIMRKVLENCVKKAEERGAERILFAMGFCGGSLEGITSAQAEIILPKVDDCITLLLGSKEKRQELQSTGHIYYITKGWMANKGVLYNQFLDIMNRYGEEQGAEIFQMLAGRYTYYGILDTHCYDMTEVVEKTKGMAEEMGMECFVADASDSYLRELLSGNYDSSRFIRLAPGEAATWTMVNH